jgi:hypothetical protein
MILKVFNVNRGSGEVEDSVLVGKNAGSQDNWVPTFRRCVLILSRRVDH